MSAQPQSPSSSSSSSSSQHQAVALRDEHERLFSTPPLNASPPHISPPTSSPLSRTASLSFSPSSLSSPSSSQSPTPRHRPPPALLIQQNGHGGRITDDVRDQKRVKVRAKDSAEDAEERKEAHSSTAAAASTPAPAPLSTPPAVNAAISAVRFNARLKEVRAADGDSTSDINSSDSEQRIGGLRRGGGAGGGEEEEEEAELDLDMIDAAEAGWSSDELDSPAPLTFEESSIGASHAAPAGSAAAASSSAFSPSPLSGAAPRYAIIMSIASLSIAVLSMSAVGPMFLFLEQKQHVPAILAACWRCQAMLIFLSVPTLIEWWHLAPEERSWSRLHVPPSPTSASLSSAAPSSSSFLSSAASELSPGHRKGVPSMIEMQDVDRIQTFLDEQSSQPMVAELEAEIAEEEEEERKLSKGEAEMEREKEEKRRRELHSMADADSSVTAAPSALSSPANRHRPFPSAFASKDRRGCGPKRVRLRISTVVTQSKMRLVHVSWYVMAVGLTWAASLALWVAALCYTSTARASLFSSTYPLILLAWMRWKGVQVSWLETVGVVVALVGIVTAEVVGYFTSTERILPMDLPLPSPSSSAAAVGELLEPTASSCQVVAGSSSQLVGDMMCITASFLNAMNIVWASRARRVLRLFTYTLSTTLIVTVTLAVLSSITELSPPDFSTHGLLGWLSSPDMLLMISLFGFVVGCIGVLGQNYAVRYTSPVIFSTAQLLDPGLTAVMSWIAGLERLPSISTVLGVAMVGIGIGCVVLGENGRKREREEVHSYQAVRQPTDDATAVVSSEGENW